MRLSTLGGNSLAYTTLIHLFILCVISSDKSNMGKDAKFNGDSSLIQTVLYSLITFGLLFVFNNCGQMESFSVDQKATRGKSLNPEDLDMNRVLTETGDESFKYIFEEIYTDKESGAEVFRSIYSADTLIVGLSIDHTRAELEDLLATNNASIAEDLIRGTQFLIQFENSSIEELVELHITLELSEITDFVDLNLSAQPFNSQDENNYPQVFPARNSSFDYESDSSIDQTA